jgi:glycosyltransferase involved in cell wall biosynthesis
VTVALVMIARDEADTIGQAIESARPLVDAVHVLDTGSTDDTPAIAADLGAFVQHAAWEGFAEARTRALALAREADWILMIDADMTVEQHPKLGEWLDADPDPEVQAWRILVKDRGLSWRMPWLLRGRRDWGYAGETHSYLVGDGKRRNLLGLTLHHHGTYDMGKIERDIEALAPGVADGDPRSVYYTAQSLKGLGRVDEAIRMYQRRARMVGTWEEERWHASYMAARLEGDVDALIACWRDRPHRPEPLMAAARAVRAVGHDDVLFLEEE